MLSQNTMAITIQIIDVKTKNYIKKKKNKTKTKRHKWKKNRDKNEIL
jgi:hypothetical protein